MGLSFSSLHFRRTPTLTRERAAEAVCAAWERQGYRRVEYAQDAELTLELLGAEDSAWFSLQSEDLDLSGPDSMRRLAAPLSRDLGTAVLAVSCIDSDCLCLNWIDEAKKLDAWANVGSCPGPAPRRTRFHPWKKVVPDLSVFRRIIKADYLFAEEALHALAPILELRESQALPDGMEHPEALKLYFTCPDAPASQGHPKLVIPTFEQMPCRPETPFFLSAVNRGDPSRGLAIAFYGPWVEHDEIRITDLQLESDMDKYPRRTQPLTAEKTQDGKGNWILLAEVPHFPLPAARPTHSSMKQLREEFARSFGVRFTPMGASRKYLDISVIFIPLEDVSGQCGWCVWSHAGSREAYIRQYNELWSRIPNSGVELLDPNDYDL